MSTEYLNRLCLGCFSLLDAQGIVCPVCGYNEAARLETPYYLPLRTILGGKYMVGKVIGEGGFGITYIGYDLNLETKAAIKEYYPSGFVTRDTSQTSTVQPFTGAQADFFTKGRDRFVDEARRLARLRALPGIVTVNDFFAENGTAYIVMHQLVQQQP